MAKDESQRREMVRVDDVLEIRHKTITPAEKESLGREIIDRSSGGGGMETVASILQSAGRTVDPDAPTWRAISLLDKKLDLLISLLQTDTRSQEAEFIRCGVNVSGSGIRFPSQQIYKRGTSSGSPSFSPPPPPSGSRPSPRWAAWRNTPNFSKDFPAPSSTYPRDSSPLIYRTKKRSCATPSSGSGNF